MRRNKPWGLAGMLGRLALIHESIKQMSLPSDGHRPGRGVTLNPVVVLSILILLDLASLAFFYSVSFHQAGSTGPTAARIWRLADAAFCFSILHMTAASGGYSRALLASPTAQVIRLLLIATVVAGSEWLALILLDQNTDWDWPLHGPINVVSVSVIVMGLVRLLTHRVLVALANRGLMSRGIAIVGSGEHALRLVRALERRKEPWTRIVGVFDERQTRQPEGSERIEIAGNLADLIAFTREHRVDDILVSLPWGAEQRLLQILEILKVVPTNIRLAPDVIGHHFLDQGYAHLDGVPVFNVYGKPISGWGALFKRVEDLILGGLALIAVAPVMLACAIAVRLDSPGPILFRQNRFGYNNKLIGIYKFRSMYHHMRDESAGKLATENDPRVTPVGKFLRRTSLDELPQLLNVLFGQMSLVGPRPHATQAKAAGALYQEVVREYVVRHKVKPGITGWAQVMGWRGETDTEEKIIRRVECDLYYLENWSIFLDIEILFRTLFVLAGKNVY
jgi:Undecaprenyl-phosphate glucose phosphotransferase